MPFVFHRKAATLPLAPSRMANRYLHGFRIRELESLSINCRRFSMSSIKLSRRTHVITAGLVSDSRLQKESSSRRVEEFGLNRKAREQEQRSRFYCHWHK